MYKVPFKVDLSKKVIAITGAGGIICGEFARALAACGAKVALLDINYEAAKKVADEIGEKAFAVKCNCLDKEDIKAAKAAVNEKNWKLSLENLLGMKFDSDKDTDDDGLEYRDYIRMLLMLERSEHKNYRTMGAMEIKMISMGHDDFRMRNYIVSMAGTAVFSVIRRGQPYVQIISCSYI